MITKQAVQRGLMSQVTTNHETIKEWVEARGGIPSRIEGTGDALGGGVLRINFARGNQRDENLEPISWEQFFEVFERNNLAFFYQEETSSGDDSRFFKFVPEDVVADRTDDEESKTAPVPDSSNQWSGRGPSHPC